MTKLLIPILLVCRLIKLIFLVRLHFRDNYSNIKMKNIILIAFKIKIIYQLWSLDREFSIYKIFFSFYVDLALFNIILYFSPSYCLFRSFFWRFFILSNALSEFSSRLFMHVSATLWNFFTSSFIFLWFNWLLFVVGLSFWVVEALLFCYKTLRLSGSESNAVIFFWRWIALRGCTDM